MGGLFRGDAPGQTLTFRFRGTQVALYDLLGPDCGQAIVTLDDDPPRVVARFDAFSTYHRLATLPIGSGLSDAVHTVRIEIHPDPPRKAEILAQRHERMDDPRRYDGAAFYPGAILVVGKIVR